MRLLGGAALLVTVGIVVSGQSGSGGAAGEERAWKAPLAPQSLLLDVSARDGRIVAVGERGHIVVSQDGGTSWTQADVPSRALLTGIHMHDGQTGWAVGHDEIILRTTDGGATWTRVNYAPENEKPLLDVWFADAQKGLAVGAYGSMLTTSDGGQTWQPRTINETDDFHLNDISAAADGTLYIAAEAGHLYRSTDGGTTWQALPSPYKGSFFGMLPLADGTLLAYGLRGHLFRSADQGQTWAPIQTDTEETLTSALDLGEGRYVVGGMAGTLLWGQGAGTTVQKQELPDRKANVGLAPGEGRTLLLFGEGGARRVDMPR